MFVSLSMNTAEMITHLHVEHGYTLVQCNRDHHLDSCESSCYEDHHTPECFTLPDTFVWSEDALLRHQLTKSPLSSVVLVDHRTGDQKTRAAKTLRKQLEGTTESVAENVSPEPSVPSPPLESRSSAPLSTVPLPHALDEARLRRCVAAFQNTDPAFADHDIANTLASEDMWLHHLLDTSATELRALISGFTLGGAKSFLKFAKEWEGAGA